jgi:hypothetical protein
VAACARGDILSRIFDKPLAIMSTSSYRAEAGTVQGALDIARYITTPKGEIAGRVLLVDDLADSGLTLNAVVSQLRNNYQPITELRTAVIWTKGLSTFKADYSVDFCPPTPGSISPSRATTRSGRTSCWRSGRFEATGERSAAGRSCASDRLAVCAGRVVVIKSGAQVLF